MNEIKAFSKNIIFFDTEFSSLNPYKGEILSLGLVKLDGQELYLELDFKGDVDSWPKENILPNLTKDKINKEQAIKLIKNFIGDEKPYLVACMNQFDMIYFYKLIGLDNFNEMFNWVPIDFASILFSQGVDPEVLSDWNNDYLDKLQIDSSKLKQHNSLDDAKLLKEIYIKTQMI